MTPDLPRLAPGEVWLVGAGPGDPGLLTLLAARALEDADVVVHDALVDPGVLAMARGGARASSMPASAGGRPSPCQPGISARLVAEAKAGARVLRLKGGDPFVFGRGGEEALALAAARVPFRIVPGVTGRHRRPRLCRHPGHAPGRQLGRHLRFRPRRAGRGGPRLGGARKGLAGARLLHGAQAHRRHRRVPDGARPARRRSPPPSSATPPPPASMSSKPRWPASAGAAREAESPAVIAIGPITALRPRLDWLGRLGEG